MSYKVFKEELIYTFFPSYVKCAIQTGLLSAIYSIVEQYLLYILLTLTVRFTTGFCLIAAVLILTFLARSEIREMQMTSYSVQGKYLFAYFRNKLVNIFKYFIVFY